MEFLKILNAPVVASNSIIVGAFNSATASSIGGAATIGVKPPVSDGWFMTGVSFYNILSSMTVMKTCPDCSPSNFVNTPIKYTVDTTSFTNVVGKYLEFGGLKRDVVYDVDGTYTI